MSISDSLNLSSRPKLKRTRPRFLARLAECAANRPWPALELFMNFSIRHRATQNAGSIDQLKCVELHSRKSIRPNLPPVAIMHPAPSKHEVLVPTFTSAWKTCEIFPRALRNVKNLAKNLRAIGQSNPQDPPAVLNREFRNGCVRHVAAQTARVRLKQIVLPGDCLNNSRGFPDPKG